MTEKNTKPSTEIPEDFPVCSTIASISGAQPKLALVEVEGRYYPEGATPEDRRAQYEMCEDLAHQGVVYCQRKLSEGVVADPTAALKRLHKGLQDKHWCSAEQNLWIVRRVAALLSWPAPDSLSPESNPSTPGS
jgi:hypothetical protein